MEKIPNIYFYNSLFFCKNIIQFILLNSFFKNKYEKFNCFFRFFLKSNLLTVVFTFYSDAGQIYFCLISQNKNSVTLCVIQFFS